jgi:hypothetical protein
VLEIMTQLLGQWFDDLRSVSILTMVLAMTIGSTACSQSKKDVTWKEEVRLTSNAIIVIERTQSYRRVSEPGAGSGWLFDHAKLMAQMPNQTASVSWEGDLQPLILDLDEKGTIYLLGTVQGYKGRRAYGVVEGTRYVRFRFENGAWIRIPLDQFPRNLKPNLLASVHELFEDDKKPSVTQVDIALKTKLDSDRRLPELYRTLIDLK